MSADALSMADVPPARPMASRAEAFQRAQRHSRLVRVLKWLLPACALIVAGLFVFYSWRSVPAELVVEAENSSVSDGRLVMSNPQLDGFTRTGQAYSMIASRATQALGDTNVVELDEINAKLPLNETLSAVVKAARGTYDRIANRLVINGGPTSAGVSIEASDGTKAEMQNVSVDIGESLFQATGSVSIERGDTAISAETLAVSEGGKLLIFEKQVRMTIQPGRGDAANNGDGNANL